MESPPSKSGQGICGRLSGNGPSPKRPRAAQRRNGQTPQPRFCGAQLVPCRRSILGQPAVDLDRAEDRVDSPWPPIQSSGGLCNAGRQLSTGCPPPAIHHRGWSEAVYEGLRASNPLNYRVLSFGNTGEASQCPAHRFHAIALGALLCRLALTLLWVRRTYRTHQYRGEDKRSRAVRAFVASSPLER